jgi:hypothetical protein
LLKFLNVKHKLFAIARAGQETVEAPTAAYGLLDKPLGHCAKSHRFHYRLHLSGLTCFLDF